MSAISQPAFFIRAGFNLAYLPSFEVKLFVEGEHVVRLLTNIYAQSLSASSALV